MLTTLFGSLATLPLGIALAVFSVLLLLQAFGVSITRLVGLAAPQGDDVPDIPGTRALPASSADTPAPAPASRAEPQRLTAALRFFGVGRASLGYALDLWLVVFAFGGASIVWGVGVAAGVPARSLLAGEPGLVAELAGLLGGATLATLATACLTRLSAALAPLAEPVVEPAAWLIGRTAELVAPRSSPPGGSALVTTPLGQRRLVYVALAQSGAHRLVVGEPLRLVAWHARSRQFVALRAAADASQSSAPRARPAGRSGVPSAPATAAAS